MDIDRRSVKLLLTYDPIPEARKSYFNYVLGEFIPQLEQLGLTMSESWHTAYGAYPLRLIAFTAPDGQTMEEVLNDPSFDDLESRLKDYVANYQRRIVPSRSRFQF